MSVCACVLVISKGLLNRAILCSIQKKCVQDGHVTKNITVMNTITALTLIRHGQSTRQVALNGNFHFTSHEHRKQLNNLPDHQIPLTAIGWRQSQHTGTYLWGKYHAPDVIFHSGYMRTVQTTAGLLSGFPEDVRQNIVVHENMLLREREAGYTYAMTDEEVKVHFPWHQAYWDRTGPLFAVPPGGESIAQVVERLRVFLNELQYSCHHRRVWFVCHGRVIQAFRIIMEDLSIEQATTLLATDVHPANCSVTRYEMDPDSERLKLITYNDQQGCVW
jgi:broad specificity phosphatase PhoE